MRFLIAELAPYPGRAATVARTVTACLITMLLVMVFQLPNGFLAVFYALAISAKTRDPPCAMGWASCWATWPGWRWRWPT